jgi:thiol-disulfide isomerase/thioredoxin
MLLIALGGRKAAERSRVLREHAVTFRRALGVVVGATAPAIALNVDSRFQTAIPGYTSALQSKIEDSAYARHQLAALTGPRRGAARAADADGLGDFGRTPGFHGISEWFNTPAAAPLSPGSLQGKVVLVDFWTYTCINCLRTLPHVEGWYERYRGSGLIIVGVHTPEFAFERVPSNVRAAIDRLGVTYPVALDNDYATWNAFANRYWPAKYLIDRRGRVRYAHFGEGRYEETEDAIRTLLAEPGERLPNRVRRPDPTPLYRMTPETYLGYGRLQGNVGEAVLPGSKHYTLPPKVPQNTLAFGGWWRSEQERAVAGKNARLRLHFYAKDVYLVLSGRGRVGVTLNGRALRSVRVRTNRLYTLVRLPQPTDGVLDLRFSPSVAGYAFTFG